MEQRSSAPRQERAAAERPLASSAASTTGSAPPQKGTVFYISKRGADARAVQVAGELVVLAGSVISRDPTPSCPDGALAERAERAGVIGEDMALLADVPFRTPSGAACFVLGRSANGRREWKTKDGVALGECEARA